MEIDSVATSSLVTEPDLSILIEMGKYGVPLKEWSELSPLIERNLLLCLDDFRKRKPEYPNGDFDTKRLEIQTLLQGFYQAPFTLQRICELILKPDEHNRNLDSLLRSFEILLSVSSTIPISTKSELVRLENEFKKVVEENNKNSTQATTTTLKRTDTVEMDVVDS